MGNTDSNFTCEGAELQSAHTWFGHGQRKSGRSWRKPNQPIRSQTWIQRQTNHSKVDLNLGFGTAFTGNIFEGAWPVAHDDNVNNNSGSLSIKSGSLSSDESFNETTKCDNNLSNGSCQDSGFGESFTVPSPVSSSDLVSSPDLKNLRTGGESQEKKDVFKTRIRKLSDWTGSLRIKKRRVQDPELSSIWSFNPLQNQNQDLPQIHLQNPDQEQTRIFQDQHFSVYQSFRQDLDSKSLLESIQTSSDRDSVNQEDLGGSRPGLSQDQDLDRGVVRRAGWICIKPLIKLNKDKLELVSRRKWRKYWVKLRGCWLQFFKSPGLDLDRDPEQDVSPQMELRVWDSLVQPVPEHPSREHVFCLSNALGEVYLLQASSQSDLEAWVTSIHSVAAATAARRSGHHGDTLDFLRDQVHFLSQRMESDQRVKKMAALQLSLITETHNRRSVLGQISQWEQSVERLSVDLFRFKCYVSSLRGLELPNPKNPLSVASRSSKCMLGRLGVFSVSTLHALVCSRDQATLRRHSRALIGQNSERQALIGQTRRRRSLKSSLKTVEHQRSEDQTVTAPQVQEEEQREEVTLQLNRTSSYLDYGFAVIGQVDEEGRSHIYISQVDPTGLSAKQGLCVGDQVMSVNGASVSRLDLDLIPSVFSHRTLLLMLRRRHQSHDPPPANQEWPQPRPSCDLRDTDSWTPLSDEPLLTITEQTSFSVSLSWKRPLTLGALCWVLPHEEEERHEEEEDVREKTVPGLRGLLEETHCCLRCGTPSLILSSERINSLYQIFPECRAADPDVPRNPYESKEASELQTPSSPSRLSSSPSYSSSSPSHSGSSPSHLSVCQRLRKVIEELLETEKSYVKDLVLLFDLYLTPLQQETFLSKDEMEALFGSLPAMLDFQRVFLQTLEEKIDLCPDLSSLETPEQFKNLLFSLGGSFLYYADHFKLYGGFCANHLKVQTVLQRAKTDAAFKHFLDARNPTNQHSASLESFLIKPVQRVLKYPLLLRELVSLTEEQTPERIHLTEALRSMEKVASHINEMQKIYEEYGSVFERLTAENSAPYGQVTELSMGDFLLHSAVLWVNPFPSLGRMRKDPQISLFVFKQALILVYKDPKVKKRLVSRSDLDPFRFRWLIPASAAQIRNHDITDGEFELVHLRSESEGRPESVFQLSSSDAESKALVLETLRSLLKDNAPHGSIRRPFLNHHNIHHHGNSLHDSQRHHGDDGLHDEEETDQLEAQLQRLHFGDQSEPRDESGCGLKKRGRGLEHSGRGLDEWRRSLVELGGLLDRDYSVQSLTSIINEDCFYSSIRRRKPAAGLTS